MTSMTVYPQPPVSEFDSGVPGVAPILASGTVIDSSQLSAVVAAASVAGVVLVQGTPPSGVALNPEILVPGIEMPNAASVQALTNEIARAEAAEALRVLDRGSWAAATAYAVNDQVLAPDSLVYLCIQAHTSGGTFTGDPSKWAARGAGKGAYERVVPGLVYDGVTDNLAAIEAELVAYGVARIPGGANGGNVAISAPLFIGAGQAVIMPDAMLNPESVTPACTCLVPTSGFSATLTSAQQAAYPGLATVNSYARSNAGIIGVTYVGQSVTVTSGVVAAVGQQVVVAGVQGVTNVNGTWTVTAVGAGIVTFTVTGTPTGAYTVGGFISAMNPDITVPALTVLAGDEAKFYGITEVPTGVAISNLYIAAQNCEFTSAHVSKFNGTVVLDTGIQATKAAGTSSHGQHTFDELTIRGSAAGSGGNAYTCGLDIESYDWLGGVLRVTGASKVFNGGGCQFGIGHLTGAGNYHGYNTGIGASIAMGLVYFDSGTVADLVRHWSTGTFNTLLNSCRFVNNGGTAGMNVVNQQSTTCGVTVRSIQFGTSSETFGAMVAHANSFDDVDAFTAPSGLFAGSPVSSSTLYPNGLPGRYGQVTVGGTAVMDGSPVSNGPQPVSFTFTAAQVGVSNAFPGTWLPVTIPGPGAKFYLVAGSWSPNGASSETISVEIQTTNSDGTTQSFGPGGTTGNGAAQSLGGNTIFNLMKAGTWITGAAVQAKTSGASTTATPTVNLLFVPAGT